MKAYDNAEPPVRKEIALPSYLIILGMVVITIIIVIAFAGPLNTSPDQAPHALKQSLEQE